jgi:fatty-acyl-CoA synthase
MEYPVRHGVPQCTIQDFETHAAGRHRLHDVIAWWAARRPDEPVVLSYDRSQILDWKTLDRASTGLALELLRRGFRKSDFLACSLPMSIEHILLEYACFKAGIIHTPLDLRLRPPEVLRCLEIVKPKGFAYLMPELSGVVKSHCTSVEHLLAQSDISELIAHAQSDTATLAPRLAEISSGIDESDPAQVIFTTGSTGSPKAALLSHRNITCQNFCLGTAFGFGTERILLNLPPSHVGGQAEILMTALFSGGSVVTLEIFDAMKSLDAIQRYGVTMLGQIPAMFQFEWRLADYSRYEFSKLKKVAYGGQQVSRQFLERMAQMAPLFATGLGLTEAAGFCTYTPMTSSVDEISQGIGYDMPAYSMSIRREIKEDGTSGEALPDGEVGNICFHGPQTFLEYVNDPVATAKTVSRDHHLYTGDLGWKDEKGLHFSARAKWVIKPAGNQVFPGDVENHICMLQGKVASCGAVGAEHRLLSEAIVAYVEKRPGADVSVAELKQHARGLTSYMRPLHYVLLEPGQMPLNRAAKIDYVRLSEMAKTETAELRAKGRWDL